MRHTLKTHILAILTTSLFSCIALPGIASADICEKIDYTFSSKIYDQVVLYAQNSVVYASDAACVLSKIAFPSVQEKIGVYLTSRIVDPENINLMLDAVTFSSTKESITKAGIQNSASRPAYQPPRPQPQHRPNPHYSNVHHESNNYYQYEDHRYDNRHHGRPSYGRPSYGRPDYGHREHPQAPKVNIARNVSSKIDYTFSSKIMGQVRLYVGDGYIYASDAADILRNIEFSSTQKEVGSYLCPKIIDRENIDQLINVPVFSTTREAIMKACMN